VKRIQKRRRKKEALHGRKRWVIKKLELDIAALLMLHEYLISETAAAKVLPSTEHLGRPSQERSKPSSVAVLSLQTSVTV